MKNNNILIIIDELELKYFEFNKLVTNFWLIFEFLRRSYNVFVCCKNDIFLKKNEPFAKCFKSFFKGDLKYEKTPQFLEAKSFSAVFFRPDPPVNTDYMNATKILNFFEQEGVFCINSANALNNINEKLYVNSFPSLAPDNIVTSDIDLIKEFLFKKNEIILKPLNECFSSNVFYLCKNDKNVNTIIKTITNLGKTSVMVQEFLPDVSKGDKRLIFINGEILPYCIGKVASSNDFKFNEHKDENFIKTELTEAQKKFEKEIKEKLLQDGIYMAGLDVIEDKIIEINITSPCFFINEINSRLGIKLEQIITDKLEKLIKSHA